MSIPVSAEAPRRSALGVFPAFAPSPLRPPLRPRRNVHRWHSPLLNRLIAEWRQPASGAQQPIIIEESAGQNVPVHIYVIWDDWAPIGSIERSEVIMDAYEQLRGRGGGLNVTVAMGLTPVEADRLGIRY